MFDTGAPRRYCAGVENGGDILPHPADTTRKTAMTASRPSLGGVPGTARSFASSYGKATTAQGRGGQSDEIGQGGPLYPSTFWVGGGASHGPVAAGLLQPYVPETPRGGQS